MITPALYSTLSADERRLWHSHVFEVKSGMLIMPGPAALPNAVWEAAETKEMEQVVGLYGKTYHFWQVDRGDKVPLGEAQLMMSFTDMGQFPRFEDVVGDRDARFGVSWERKRGKRADIVEPEVHPGKGRGAVCAVLCCAVLRLGDVGFGVLADCCLCVRGGRCG